MKLSSVFRVGLLTATIVAVTTTLPAWARPARIVGQSQDSQVNVRDVASTNSVIVAYATGGEVVEVLSSTISEEDGYGWYKVRLSNRAIGWIRADLVRFGVPVAGQNPPRPLPIGDDSDVGYTMRVNAGGKGNQLAVRSAPGLDGNVAFYGRHGDRVIVQRTFTNRDGTWYYVTYPKALRTVTSSGWVRQNALVR